MAGGPSGFYRHLGKAAAALVIAGGLAAVPTIKDYEGRSLTPYYDGAHVLTYCDGETLNVDANRVYTDRECDELTKKRALQFAKGVADRLQVVVTQKTFEALVTFAYNVGLGNFGSSTALKEINAGDTVAGCEAMIKFSCIRVKPGTGDTKKPDQTKFPGVDCRTPEQSRTVSRGLFNRRMREVAACLAGAKLDL